jgi:hypothetical protein
MGISMALPFLNIMRKHLSFVGRLRQVISHMATH